MLFSIYIRVVLISEVLNLLRDTLSISFTLKKLSLPNFNEIRLYLEVTQMLKFTPISALYN